MGLSYLNTGGGSRETCVLSGKTSSGAAWVLYLLESAFFRQRDPLAVWSLMHAFLQEETKDRTKKETF